MTFQNSLLHLFTTIFFLIFLSNKNVQEVFASYFAEIRVHKNRSKLFRYFRESTHEFERKIICIKNIQHNRRYFARNNLLFTNFLPFSTRHEKRSVEGLRNSPCETLLNPLLNILRRIRPSTMEIFWDGLWSCSGRFPADMMNLFFACRL